jgi:hypothetical protein
MPGRDRAWAIIYGLMDYRLIKKLDKGKYGEQNEKEK